MSVRDRPSPQRFLNDLALDGTTTDTRDAAWYQALVLISELKNTPGAGWATEILTTMERVITRTELITPEQLRRLAGIRRRVNDDPPYWLSR